MILIKIPKILELVVYNSGMIGTKNIAGSSLYVLYKNIIYVRQRHHDVFSGGENFAPTLLFVPVAVEESDRLLAFVIRRDFLTLVRQHVIIAAQDNSGSVVRCAITDVAYRVSQVTTIRF